MTAFTRVGSSVWDWEPFVELSHLEGGNTARLFWFSLYTTAQARKNVVGLWQGGVPTMADAARMQPDDVRNALDLLLEHELVEYDPRSKVLRLCLLPDPGEYPSNGKVILSWWTRFNTVPNCQVRDAHVRTLRWILDEGALRSMKTVSADHESAWKATFGTVSLPALRRRGLRRLADSDTSTIQQPSLFSHSANALPLGNGIEASAGSAHPQIYTHAVDNSASLRQLNKINMPETVSDTVSDTNRIPDPGSRIPDLSLLSGEGRGRGGHETGMGKTIPFGPYTPREALAALARGPWDPVFDLAYQDAICALIPVWVSRGCGLAELALLSEYNRHIQRTWNARMLVGCDIATEVERARKTIDWRDVQVANFGKVP